MFLSLKYCEEAYMCKKYVKYILQLMDICMAYMKNIYAIMYEYVVYMLHSPKFHYITYCFLSMSAYILHYMRHIYFLSATYKLQSLKFRYTLYQMNMSAYVLYIMRHIYFLPVTHKLHSP